MDAIWNWLFDGAFPRGTNLSPVACGIDLIGTWVGVTLLPRWWRRKGATADKSFSRRWQEGPPGPLPSGKAAAEGAPSGGLSTVRVGGTVPDARHDLLKRIAQHAPDAGLLGNEPARSDHATTPGMPLPATPRRDAAAALATIPENVLALFSDPEAVQVALPALALFSPRFRPLLEATGRRQYFDPIRSLWNLLDGIGPRQQVALMDRCLQTLAAARPEAAQQTLHLMREIVAATAGDHWQVHAWAGLAEDAVSPPRLPKRAKSTPPTKLIGELIELLSVVALAAEDSQSPSYRFHRGWGSLPLPEASRLPAEVLAFSDLEKALAKVATTPAALRAQVCDACTLALTTDGELDTTQAALLRLIRQRLGHPPYPVLPGPVSTA
jgi:hypothetical protein